MAELSREGDIPSSRGRAINRAAYHPPHLRIRKEQIVVDNAPACLVSIDHAHPEPLDGSLLGGADARHPTSDSSRQRQRFFFSGGAATEIYTLSLHDALPI